MSLHPVAFASALAIAALGVTPRVAEAAACAPKGIEPVDTIHQMYAGAMAGDRATTLATFDRDALLFDGGMRFTPPALVDFILKAEASGTRFQWNIEGAESHTTCDLAWATWTNVGSFTTKASVEPKAWLESAVFVWRAGAWKIRFFHSTPMAKAF